MDICGGQRNVSNLIEYMVRIGLLEVESNQYQYNATHEEYNRSKEYRYYYENERKIEEYCEINNIKKKIVRNNDYWYIHTVVEKFDINDFDNNQVRFSSKLNLV